MKSDPIPDLAELRRHFDYPRPRLYASDETEEGYLLLEYLERGAILQALRTHTVEVSLWYRLLTEYRRAMTGEFDLSGEKGCATDEQKRAFGLQLQLLGLGIGTAKSALDRLLAGYYSQALGDIRHMAESVLHVHYLTYRPDNAHRWYASNIQPQKQPVNPKDAYDLIISRAKLEQLPGLEGRASIAINTWKLAHKGAHPSPEGVRQTAVEARDGRFVFGALYERELALIGFDHGLSAVWLLAETAAGFSPRFDVVLPSIQAISKEVGEWRSTISGFQEDDLPTSDRSQDLSPPG